MFIVLQFNADNEFDFDDETNFDSNTLNEILNEIESKKIRRSSILKTTYSWIRSMSKKNHEFENSKSNENARVDDFDEINVNDKIDLNFNQSKNIASFFKMSMQIDKYEKFNKIAINRLILNRFWMQFIFFEYVLSKHLLIFRKWNWSRYNVLIFEIRTYRERHRSIFQYNLFNIITQKLNFKEVKKWKNLLHKISHENENDKWTHVSIELIDLTRTIKNRSYTMQYRDVLNVIQFLIDHFVFVENLTYQSIRCWNAKTKTRICNKFHIEQ